MTDNGRPEYQMTLSLNVLNHLGLGLYSNVPAVLSEAVANAWDADAENVNIVVDTESQTITIEDDGHGMSVTDVNKKYLRVGYKRREVPDGAITPKFERPVMGRKGIGKLSLFSIAKIVEVHSVKDSEPHGFRMDIQAIEKAIKGDGEKQYRPESVPFDDIDINKGTKITLTDLKRQIGKNKWLKRRLARRFSIIGANHSFAIYLNDEPITIEDRDYYNVLQYIWTYGTKGEEVSSAANAQKHDKRPNKIEKYQDGDHKIDGWIGTAERAGQLKDNDTSESLNKIVIMVRGKLAQEDILEEFGEGGVYSKYIMGEIHADFLDKDDKDDIATTSRQKIIEEDERYQALKEKLRTELKYIQQKWTGFRNEEGQKAAITVPQIKEWFTDLNPDHKKVAQKLFGRIFQLPIDDDPDQQRQLWISSILAFESLKLRNILHRIEEISLENLDVLREIFVQLDDLESSAYYQISKERLGVIRKLDSLVDENAIERALQEHLVKHLWLLDPSWERATRTVVMERSILNALKEVDTTLTEEQRRSRLDIYYSATGNKHVIIELKRASKLLDTNDLLSQIEKYRNAVTQVLRNKGKGKEPLEIVCVVGRRLKDWSNINGEKESRGILDIRDTRVVLYDELIQNALEAYQDYINREKEAGKVYNLITSIDAMDLPSLGVQLG